MKLSIDSKEDFYELSRIASEALSYVVSKKAIESLKYILMFCREKFIIPKILDTLVLQLLKDYKNKQSISILRTMIQYEVIINYSKSGAKDVGMLINEVRQKSKPPSKQKNKDSDRITSEKSEEEKYEHQYNLAEDPINSPLEQEDPFEYGEIPPKRFTSDGEIFRREHIAEIMLRSRIYSEEQEIEIFRKLYGDFSNIGNTDVRIIKILIVYNKFNIFKKIIDSKANDSSESDEDDFDDASKSFISAKFEEATIYYKTNDIIVEAIIHWLKTDNIPFFHKIFSVFRMRVELRWLEVQKIIIQSFTEWYQNGKQINFLFDKIKFIEILASSVLSEVSIALKFIQIMKKLIKENYILNIFTNYHNPFRLFILLIKMLRVFGDNTESMAIDLNLIQEDIEGIMIQIIDDWNNAEVLRNWMFDVFEEGLTVIDLLAQMNLLRILNIPKIAKIVEQVWTGNYDQRKNNTIFQAVKISQVGEKYRNLNIDLDTMITVVGKKRCWSFLIYSSKIFGNSVKNIWKPENKSAKDLLRKKSLIKTPAYGFMLYKNSIFLQANIESFATLIIIFWIFIILILEIISRGNLRSTYSNITRLQSQTQTTSVLAQIESEYSNLKSYGDDWYIRFRALTILNSMVITFFIQDFLIYLSFIVRKISTSALSKILTTAILIDFVHVVGAIYLIVRYLTYYDISRTLSRSEEKYYRMFEATEAGGVQPKVIFAYLVIVMMYRLLFQMVYFNTFGALVQIIIQMIVSCFKFLILSLIFLVAFTILGYILFNDIDQFKSIFWSFNTMYQSVFGGFDFTIYSSSTITPEFCGRIFMCLFLLGFAVLVMNFLIAILSEVYGKYIVVANALQKWEIIKLRPVYEPHKHYGCLVRAPIFLNYYMVIMAPLVVIFKSQKLNSALIFIQYFTLLFFFVVFLILNLVMAMPILILILAFIKLKYISSKAKSAVDVLVRLVDIFVAFITIPIYICLLVGATLILETKNQFKENLVQIIGIYSRQYQYANNVMDGSTNEKIGNKLDFVDSQRTYFRFKRFVNPLRSKQIQYNPTDFMISEIAVSLMIASMKIVKREVQLAVNDGEIDDSIPLFIPTGYVVAELRKIFYLSEQFRALLFGRTYEKHVDVENPKLKYIISTLADKTLDGLEFYSDKQENLDNIKDNGTNLMTLAATLSNHEQRVQFWKNKLFKLFTESNNQWLIDQFQICKDFLYLNSYEADISEVKKEVWEASEDLKILYIKYQKKDDKYVEVNKNDEEKWRSGKFEEIAPDQNKNNQLKIHLIDLPTFIGPMIGFESKIRGIIRGETENGKNPITRELKKRCWAMNQITLTRFVSSHMSTCYSACNTYATKE